MKCDKCDREATVHEVSIKGGKRHEKHLCEHCARDQGVGVVGGPGLIQSHSSVDKLVQGYIAIQSQGGTAAVPSAQPASACPACGLTFAQFRGSGVLGCARCYTVFEGQLSPLLSRAHEGGTHHVGKVPAPVARSADAEPLQPVEHAAEPAQPESAAAESLARRLALLRKSLDEAVQGEQYEKAAKLRDEIQRIQAQAGRPETPARKARPGSDQPGDRA